MVLAIAETRYLPGNPQMKYNMCTSLPISFNFYVGTYGTSPGLPTNMYQAVLGKYM